MNKTKIEYADYTWNPVSGCLNSCPYCYAQRIANRFGLKYYPKLGDPGMEGACKYDSTDGMDTMLELEKPYIKDGRAQPYPMNFQPTFHKYRLDEPQKLKKPSKIFVCSMADLFGEWTPDSWIDEVMMAMTKAPQHTYLFLTKNPDRYFEYIENSWQEIPEKYDFSKIKSVYFGATITNQNDLNKMINNDTLIDFLSIEPLLSEVDISKALEYESCCSEELNIKWIIVGAQTGPGAIPPKPEWVQSIIDQCRAAKVPIFLKDSLKWTKVIQEYPESMRRGNIETDNI